MRTADRVHDGLHNIYDARNLQIGERVENRRGDRGTILGVGIIDYHPDGPAYEVVEVEDEDDGQKRLEFMVDLTPEKEWEDD